jgi:hypothetical protein
MARSTWLVRPEPLAQAEPAEKATRRTSASGEAAHMLMVVISPFDQQLCGGAKAGTQSG